MTYSVDNYLENFTKLDNIIKDALKKQPNNPTLIKMLQLSDNMFYFTSYSINKYDGIDIENRLLYDKLHKTQTELHTLKLHYDRKISKNSKRIESTEKPI